MPYYVVGHLLKNGNIRNKRHNCGCDSYFLQNFHNYWNLYKLWYKMVGACELGSYKYSYKKIVLSEEV